MRPTAKATGFVILCGSPAKLLPTGKLFNVWLGPEGSALGPPDCLLSGLVRPPALWHAHMQINPHI